jgi:hypothetical protein
MKKKTYLIFAIAIVGLISLSAVAAVTPASTANKDVSNDIAASWWWWGGNDDTTNDLNWQYLEPGDFVILGTEGSFFDYLIPGDYSHAVMYCGTVQPGEQIWDRDNHEWMAVGTPYVIHSTKSDNAGNGLGYSTWEEAVNNHAEFARSLEVDGVSTAEKQECVDFLKGELDDPTGQDVGPKYDWGWLYKQWDADTMNYMSWVRGYYCSEAVWAAYWHCHGIQLDPDGFGWSWSTTWGVSPDDLMDDGDSSTIEYND